MLFTGNKNVDMKILSELSDTDLANTCKVNITAKKYCNDESFWLNRTLARFSQLGNPDKLKIYKGNITWKEYYIRLINFLEHYYEDPNIKVKDTDLNELIEIIKNNTNNFLEKHPQVTVKDIENIDLNDLLDLGYIFIERFDQNDISDLFKSLLKNRNFKDISVMMYIGEDNNLLNILFEDKRINNFKTQRELFLNLMSLFEEPHVRGYFNKLLKLMTTENILRSIYYTLEIDPDWTLEKVNAVFDELKRRGLNKDEMRELYQQISQITPIRINEEEIAWIWDTTLFLIRNYIERNT